MITADQTILFVSEVSRSRPSIQPLCEDPPDENLRPKVEVKTPEMFPPFCPFLIRVGYVPMPVQPSGVCLNVVQQCIDSMVGNKKLSWARFRVEPAP